VALLTSLLALRVTAAVIPQHELCFALRNFLVALGSPSKSEDYDNLVRQIESQRNVTSPVSDGHV
jgi:hypothetical protein